MVYAVSRGFTLLSISGYRELISNLLDVYHNLSMEVTYWTPPFVLYKG